MARVLVGTSGWSYASWRGPFFPMGLPAKRQLEYYASQFETVELNGVFYRTPTTESVGRWRDGTGRHFVFAWKASKFITHWKRLTENSLNSLQLLEDRLSILGDKVGPISFSCHRISRRTLAGSAPSWHFFRSTVDTALNSAIPVGTRQRFFACSPIAISRSVFPITTTRLPHGSARLTSSMCVGMARMADTRGDTREQRLLPGASRSRRGTGPFATSMSTSTTIRRAPRLWTPSRCSAC